jgi:hypothetical protein
MRKAAVVITDGFAEHSGRYEHVAQALNAAAGTPFTPTTTVATGNRHRRTR